MPPNPLGACAFRRSRGAETAKKISRLVLSQLCPLLYKTIENSGYNYNSRRLSQFTTVQTRYLELAYL